MDQTEKNDTSPEEIAQKELDRKIELISYLDTNENFREWRELVIKPVLDQVKDDLKAADEFPEAVLRAKLKHYFSMEEQYYAVFENIRLQRKDT